MTPEELREKVARACAETIHPEGNAEYVWAGFLPEADAAIRVVLEAAIDHLDNKEWPANLSAPDHLRSFLPQDKQEDAA